MIGVYILTIIISYLIGSLPTGYLAGKARGVDIRTVGSGNIGATNVLRVLGKTAGISVLLVDGFKGFAATWWVPLIALQIFPSPSNQKENLPLVAGVSAVLGHIYTCWLRFRGGKGIATSAGVAMAWAPLACLSTLGIWTLVFAGTRFVSVASIVAAVVLPIGVWIFGGSGMMIGVMTALSVLAIYRHKANISRLMEGTEHRASFKKDQPAP